ncbi:MULTISPECIES: DUF2848 domain-containing protein [unclassified Chelatococcus]|uniref:DUF2848 domain-containing protein n=1 Tax=unclassified Chelatococcus TaxID=2638111 RepID=UPI001BCF7D17|nr:MULTISPECIES: DUF2848 domain-containing protein [unclassified Chelatococcus]CAH1657612.1 conserved hypothetical protein [Hyphomicrobiales bacterium]MBS7742286.1 DUF2848 domain-containing protein [Chelatococcus sp. HY11]MBX3542596.1 DUF2848 domain-containing protein [Chelatococcus sp.]MCO5075187.1 DUF2848 domain-containing protein [Chelatococcus sp.]CAH1689233.1 conserved hypothetical protein [Hyphomicrobiales bacterium]
MGVNVPLDIEIHSQRGRAALRVPVSSLIIAGWTGRDKAAMLHHIRELEALGVTPPASTPIFYRMAASRLTSASHIEASGPDSSGEVEFILLRHAGQLYVGVGSDHTDRRVEVYSITVSKQMCDKPVGRTFWPYEEVASHWDQLLLRSIIREDGKDVIYQEGGIAKMLHPEALLAQLADSDGALADGDVLFGGTLAAIGGIRPSPRMEVALIDPVLDRAIVHRYDIKELPMRG